MGQTQLLGLVLLQLLWAAPAEAPGPGKEVPVVWAQEGTSAQLPCSPTIPLQDPGLLRRGGVTWQHQPDSGPAAQAPAPSRPWNLGPGREVAPGTGPQRYTVLSVAPGGLRSGRLPLQPRVQLDERGLQRGDFSLWLRPALRADAGEYHAAVRLRDRALACRLRLRVGQASMAASPAGPLRTADWVILNCSFSRPDRPASVHWFRGPGRVPVQESAHHHLAEGFLFLPQVSPVDSGMWGCVLTYRDGFEARISHNLTVRGAAALCHGHLGSHHRSAPGGKGGAPVLARRGQGVTPESSGSPGSLGKLLCEVTPASGRERFVWRPLDRWSTRNFPGPWLEMAEAQLLSQPWQCQLHQEERLLGAAVYVPESSPGAQRSGRAPSALRAAPLPLFLTLGTLSLLLLVTGAIGFHFWKRQRRLRRFSALELGIHPPQTQSKIEELEEDPEPELEPELEPEPEPELEPELEPGQL
ncbi:lymphocyte activation gene 3 protein isoform X2 [Heterocephalus glaber]|uniref:Lymphocyte activation gene 3 protein n=1 Tax=Heterocephalus glaber TaxID=10181 RepID=A0AAX6S475_HETGA|nr:lymphocyte activation gene 3 protein isoform X2 [Heterocephalus glaber]